MRFLHTSDIHLGLRLCETRLNEDLAYILARIADLAERESCQAVVLAGDIYDRSNPTSDSVAIFDDFITSLVQKGIAVLAVAGNHDAPERVGYLSAVLEKNGVHFAPPYRGELYTCVLEDAHGPVFFHLLPFLRPSTVRLLCPDFDGTTAAEALRYALSSVDPTDGKRHVLVAHQFVAGTEDAQGDAMVGGAERIGVDDYLASFDYVALGHLHSPHAVSFPHVRYAGSPLKCSFSEATDEKSVTLVELGEKGACRMEILPLSPLRDLREMRGSYEEILSPAVKESGDVNDYLRVILTDEEDIPDVMAKLRTVYPNLLRLSYDNKRTRSTAQLSADILSDCEEEALTPESVFAQLYELQYNDEPGEQLMDTVRELFARTRREGEEDETP